MGKKVSKAGKGTYARYRSSNTYARNKQRKLERHLKSFPEDSVAKKCLESGLKGGFSWKRRTPQTKQWSKPDKYQAQLWTSLGYSGKKYIDFIRALKKKVNTIIAPKSRKPQELVEA